MSECKLLTPDYLFEVSWEVCNKIGGIHTVVSTKAQTRHPESQTERLLSAHRTRPAARRRTTPNSRRIANLLEDVASGRLHRRHPHPRGTLENQRANRSAILVDYHVADSRRKDEILKKLLWEAYHVDSISGQWDYIEPVLFGYAAGRGDRLLCRELLHRDRQDRRPFPRMDDRGGRSLPAHAHAPYVATLFTTHATVMGRCIAGNHLPLYTDLDQVQRRRAGTPVQRRGQTLDREGRRCLPRRIRHGQRHHGQRVRIPAGPRA